MARVTLEGETFDLEGRHDVHIAELAGRLASLEVQHAAMTGSRTWRLATGLR